MVRIVVGGFPEPIGGVTNFIYRIADLNLVSEVIDLYPNANKSIPPNYSGKHLVFKGFTSFFVSYVFSSWRKEKTEFFFNFSTPKSLLYIFFIPKRNSSFSLLLHHGRLSCSYPSLFSRFFLRKFDKIYYLSDAQKKFFANQSVSESVLVSTTSYLPINLPKLNDVDVDIANYVKLNKKKYTIVSGYCTSIYNHHWVAQLFSDIEKSRLLLIFLYGNIDQAYYKLLMSHVQKNPNITVFLNKSSDSFNFALANAEMYLRPTTKDSFGIAVADAINFGVPVLASNVCHRYPGSHIFELSDYYSFVSSFKVFVNNRESIPVSVDRVGGSIFSFS